MSERRDAGTRKQCDRFGCSSPATAAFTFDSDTCTVWLDAIDDTARHGGLAAGELCSRHARSLRPPRDWQLEDRRTSPAPSPPTAPTSPAPSAAPSPQLAAGPARVELEAELRDLFDVQSPLLARAFRSSGTV